MSPDRFDHREHVRSAWASLRAHGLTGALERFPPWLKALAEAHGAPEKFHVTITWAYLLLVHERMAEEEDFEAFAARNPDLLQWSPSVLERYYRPETLWSERARQRFVLPDAVLEPG